MKLLFLAPQPFFQERGTPIAVKLALEVLAARLGQQRNNGRPDRIDLLTYHEGAQVEIPGVIIRRIRPPRFVRRVGPGISLKKLICDVYFFFSALSLILTNRDDQYDFIHAVEESVFFAYLFKVLFRVPYIYDMDSSLALQLTEKWRLLKPLMPVFEFLERVVVRNSAAVAPVCDALAATAKAYGAGSSFLLRDVSLLELPAASAEATPIREQLRLPRGAVLLMYIGNLEYYQGIDLLMRSFALIKDDCPNAHLVIIGGITQDIAHYRNLATQLEIAGQAHLPGPRPIEQLRSLLLQADILVSPRIKGNNTPMKIYSYLHAGRAIVATDLPTHTQVLDSAVAFLAKPTVEGFASALRIVACDELLRSRLAKNGRELAEKNYVFEVFSTSLNALYDYLGRTLCPFPSAQANAQQKFI